MAFSPKTWLDRVSEYPNRRSLTKEDGSIEIVNVSREEGNISQTGDAFNAETMNDLETRIKEGFENVGEDVLDSREEIMANNLENKMAGALVTKDLFSMLANGMVKFRVENGELEYSVYTED